MSGQEGSRRLSVAETWDALDTDGFEMPRDDTGAPLLPTAMMPSFDDEEEQGFVAYKMGWEEGDFANLSLPRSFFGRSLFENVSFRNTDLSESRMCWNDFAGCDFTGADLTRADLRASRFERCRFTGATLVGADLRQSTFDGCDFSDANMNGCIAELARRDDIEPNAEQAGGIAWQSEPGPEAPGG